MPSAKSPSRSGVPVQVYILMRGMLPSAKQVIISKKQISRMNASTRTWWSAEIGIVLPCTILGEGNDRIIALATASKVGSLEVASNFIESIAPEQIVVFVVDVEELRGSCVGIC